MGDGSSSSSGSSGGGGASLGPLGINPLHFSASLFGLLFLFVLYLLLPRGVRVRYFGSYPKRYAWSARSRGGRRKGGATTPIILPNGGGVGMGMGVGGGRQIGSGGGGDASYDGGGGSAAGLGGGRGGGGGGGARTPNYSLGGAAAPQQQAPHAPPSAYDAVGNPSSLPPLPAGGGPLAGMPSSPQQLHPPGATPDHHLAPPGSGPGGGGGGEDIVVSAAMQQLRDPGVLIVAHGSRGKPKTVRLVLTESAITWRTEMRKKNAMHGGKELKLGKLHQVPLGHIMYVDVGKQTTALRRVENAGVSESLCFSLLTKEGSLDLEANSPRERDALVQCFSLVLDEVHAQNWRDIYRGPSSDMPSSFDEGDGGNNAGGGGGGGGALGNASGVAGGGMS